MNLLKKMLMGGLAAMLLLGGVTESMAQGEVYSPDITKVNKFRYTFLWDVTLSMYGKRMTANGVADALKSPDIYDRVETTLIKQIEALDDPTAEIVVVPFQEHALVTNQLSLWRAPADKAGRAKLISKIRESKQVFQDNIVLENTVFEASGPGTNILGSLQWVTNNIFDDRIDILFLLTDGGQGSGNVKTGKSDLENYLNGEWRNFAMQRNVQGYYLMLTEDAVNGVPDIKSDTPIILVHALDLKFPIPTNIKIGQEKSLNIHDDYEKESFTVGYEVANSGKLPEGSRLKVTVENNEYIKVGGDLAFGEHNIVIPYSFKKSKLDLRRCLPEEMTLMVTFEYSCSDSKQQRFTTVSSKTLRLKLINKLQPTISVSWQ